MYGLTTNDPVSVYGIIILAVFTLKGIAAYGLWIEKEWGVQVAIADAVVGIILCVHVMIFSTYFSEGPYQVFSFRLELLFLFPYLINPNYSWYPL